MIDDLEAAIDKFGATALRIKAERDEAVKVLRAVSKWCEHNGCGVGRSTEMPWLEDVNDLLERLT